MSCVDCDEEDYVEEDPVCQQHKDDGDEWWMMNDDVFRVPTGFWIIFADEVFVYHNLS